MNEASPWNGIVDKLKQSTEHWHDTAQMLKRQRDMAEEERDGWKIRAMKAEQERQVARAECEHWKLEWSLAINELTEARAEREALRVECDALQATNTDLRDQLVLAEGQRDQAKASAEDIGNNWQRTYDYDCKKLIQRAEAAEAERDDVIAICRGTQLDDAAIHSMRGYVTEKLRIEAECEALREDKKLLEDVCTIECAAIEKLEAECEALREEVARLTDLAALSGEVFAFALTDSKMPNLETRRLLHDAVSRALTAAMAVQPTTGGTK